MSRSIDADALKAKLREGLEHYQYRPDDYAIGKVSGLVDAMEEADRAPTIDAIPVEYIKALTNHSDMFTRGAAKWVLGCWKKEQEAR